MSDSPVQVDRDVRTRAAKYVPEDENWLRFARYAIRGDARLHASDKQSVDAPPLTIQLRDIGRGGIGFVSPVRLEPDTAWQIEFLQHGHPVATQTVYVRFCTRLQPNAYHCGGQFVAPSGLLTVLGVSPAALTSEASDAANEAAFVPPAEVG